MTCPERRAAIIYGSVEIRSPKNVEDGHSEVHMYAVIKPAASSIALPLAKNQSRTDCCGRGSEIVIDQVSPSVTAQNQSRNALVSGATVTVTVFPTVVATRSASSRCAVVSTTRSARSPSSEFHRAADRLDQRLRSKAPWHRKGGGFNPQRSRLQAEDAGREGVRQVEPSAPARSSCASAAPRIHAGVGTGCGKDHTIFATCDGVVSFGVKGRCSTARSSTSRRCDVDCLIARRSNRKPVAGHFSSVSRTNGHEIR